MTSSEGALVRLAAGLRAAFGAKHVFLVSSGQAALALILLALRQLRNRTDVLLPAYTCFSVPAAVERAGLSVKLADVDPETFDFDAGALDRSVNDGTLCVVAHHLFGIPADIDRVRRACNRVGAFVVEDAAQAMGGRSRAAMLGTLGDVSFFSLGRGKSITAGSGGIILTASDGIAGALASEYGRLEKPRAATVLAELARVFLMWLSIRPSLYWLPAGLPFLRLGETRFDREFPMRRMSGLNAGLLAGWQARLTRASHRRAMSAEDFRARLGLPHPDGPDVPYLRFPVVMGSRTARDRIYASAAERGLGMSRMYPTPVNEIPEIADRFTGQSFPGAKLIADRLLTLPTHHLVTQQDRQALCEMIQRPEAPSGASATSSRLGVGTGAAP
jgi:perosamine synthetase